MATAKKPAPKSGNAKAKAKTKAKPKGATPAATKAAARQPRQQQNAAPALPAKKVGVSKTAARKLAPSKPAAAAKAATRFAGFGAPTMNFLRALADNNERAWFAEHKPRYEADVLEHALDFIAEMGPRLEKISDHFVAIPQRQGGSLMRVYKDTRFSRDKTPYKTNVGIQFRHELGKDVHAPGFYVHIEPGECFIGAGMWHPEPEALAKIRSRILEAPDEWKKVRADKRFAAAWQLGGSSLVRPPRGVAPDHPFVEDLKRKDFIAGCDIGDDVVARKDFTDFVAERFAAAAPLMRFLCRTLELQY